MERTLTTCRVQPLIHNRQARIEMNAISCFQVSRGRPFCGLLLVTLWLMLAVDARAVCGLEGALASQFRQLQKSSRSTGLPFGICSTCHLANSGGPRNEFGNAINVLLRLSEGARTDPVRQRDAGQRVLEILADPLSAESPTFGELLQLERFPASSFDRLESPLPRFPARISVSVTAEEVRELVQKVESGSRFGILQLSQTFEITPEVAAVLAEFRGEMLMLGLRSLSPDVAAALTKSQAASIWLHNVTSVSSETAELLIMFPGKIFLTSLTELDSVLLAEKLASQSGPLSFPYLKTISPEVALALTECEQSLTLAGLTEISQDVQETLSQTVGSLSLPNLTQLDSLFLAKKLAASFVLLPNVAEVSPEQVELLLAARFQGSFFGGVYLPITAITPEVAQALAENRNAINLTLIGNDFLPEEILETLLSSSIRLTLRDVEQLTTDQSDVVVDTLTKRKFSPRGFDQATLRLPNLKKLDSAQLAETLGIANGFSFPGVAEISDEAAAVLGTLFTAQSIDAAGNKKLAPSGSLSFPNLRVLSTDTARLLVTKRWASISLPAVEEISFDTLRLLASQTSQLTLGINTLPVEFAAAFVDFPTNQPMAGDSISFPHLTDLSPEAVRALVTTLNRGFREVPLGKFSNSPRLQLGGRSAFASLSPELAAELARYEGNLAIEDLDELSAESASALAAYSGPRLSLSGPVLEKLSPEAASSLAQSSAILDLPLRYLNSKPLAERLVRQSASSMFYNLEAVAQEAAPALAQYNSFFDLRALAVLDSPEMAKRFVEGTTGGSAITLPALSVISVEAANILAAGNKPIYLGLTVLDSADMSRILSNSQRKVQLPRLRAATPEVIEILKQSRSIETVSIDGIYVLQPR